MENGEKAAARIIHQIARCIALSCLLRRKNQQLSHHVIDPSIRGGNESSSHVDTVKTGCVEEEEGEKSMCPYDCAQCRRLVASQFTQEFITQQKFIVE